MRALFEVQGDDPTVVGDSFSNGLDLVLDVLLGERLDQTNSIVLFRRVRNQFVVSWDVSGRYEEPQSLASSCAGHMTGGAPAHYKMQV